MDGRGRHGPGGGGARRVLVDIDKRGKAMSKRWEDALTLIFFLGPIGLFGGGQG